jgi:serine O-acetyltransferase
VGANAVVTDDVAPGTTMVGWKARPTHVPVDAWLRDFVPYGTPCRELGETPCDAADTARVEALEAEVAALKAQVAALLTKPTVAP